MFKIGLVIPTIRPDDMKSFCDAWQDQFEKYNVLLIVVHDGESPRVEVSNRTMHQELEIDEILGEDDIDLISNFNSSVRNLGFMVAKQMGCDVIVTLDDDVRPKGDTIGDHLKALEMKVPVSWMSTTIIKDNSDYMRGFPYQVREEAPVMLSHGVWDTVPDRDALSQLVSGARKPVEFYRGVVPKGALFPFCGMNVAFKIEALPYVYYAGVGQFPGAERFDDIWGGIEMKKDFDKLGWGVVTGMAEVHHERASDPFKNLSREYIGVKENEDFWRGESKHPFFKEFLGKRKRWSKFFKFIKYK